MAKQIYTVKVKKLAGYKPPRYQARLEFGIQSFDVGPETTSKRKAEWYMLMFSHAMTNIIKAERKCHESP